MKIPFLAIYQLRLRETEYFIIKESAEKNYTKHLLIHGHNLNGEFQILHIGGKGLKLNFLDSLKFNRFKNYR